MERDYKHEARELLLRALEAMVKNIEQCNEVQVSSDRGTRHLAISDFDGEDIVRVYSAIIADQDEFIDAYTEKIGKAVGSSLEKLFAEE